MKTSARALSAGLALACLAGVALTATAREKLLVDRAPKAPDAKAPTAATHEPSKTVNVTGSGGLKLQTLGLDGEGRILGLVAQPRHFNAPAKGVISEVH